MAYSVLWRLVLVQCLIMGFAQQWYIVSNSLNIATGQEFTVRYGYAGYINVITNGTCNPGCWVYHMVAAEYQKYSESQPFRTLSSLYNVTSFNFATDDSGAISGNIYMVLKSNQDAVSAAYTIQKYVYITPTQFWWLFGLFGGVLLLCCFFVYCIGTICCVACVRISRRKAIAKKVTNQLTNEKADEKAPDPTPLHPVPTEVQTQ
jgi:hypothetical protein